jgi:serine O-acetyltransferase
MRSEIVERLCRPDGALLRSAKPLSCALPLPSRSRLHAMIERLRGVLFPGYFGDPEVRPDTVVYHVGSSLDRVRRTLEEQVGRGLCFACEECEPLGSCEEKARAITGEFLERLPRIQETLAGYVQAAYEGDPAATRPEEAIFCYPGILALTNHRIAHELHLLGVPLLPRMITEHAHGATGIDIHPGARIGESLFIDHGTGIVVGETTIIGDRVRIYQGVTLGARSFPLDEHGRPVKGIPRHPIIEDDVVIYAGATILGRVTIGKGSVIGGNVWLTRDVPPGSRITQHRPREESFTSGAGI